MNKENKEIRDIEDGVYRWGEKKNFIGFSLSMCVTDIINGKIPKDRVVALITGTKIRDDKDMEEVFTIYKKLYWKKYPIQSAKLAEYFFKNGMVIQPRITEHGLIEGVWHGRKGNGYWKEI